MTNGDTRTEVPEFGKLEQAAAVLQLSPRTVWAMGKRGEIRRHVVGRCVRYLIREYVDRIRGSHGQRH